MAIRVTLSCDVCDEQLLNGLRSEGGQTQLIKVPEIVARRAAGEGWLLDDDRALCGDCQKVIEGLGYVRQEP